MAANSLSWTPKTVGVGALTKYCSPACGAGCTKKQYEAAKRRGEEARQKMRTPDAWTVHIWENMGWYSSLECAGMSVKIEASGKYWCLFTSGELNGSGESFWTARATFMYASPQDAVDAQLQLAKEFVAKCQGAINLVESAQG